MRYDYDELYRRVLEKRKSFTHFAVLILVGIAAALVVVALNISVEVSFGAIMLTLILCFSGYRLIVKFAPKTLFSKEITGENIKEHEADRTRVGALHRRNRTIMPNTGANRKAPIRRIIGTVYLKTDDGGIEIIEGLCESHMNFYSGGDVLFKPAGAKFPSVINRPTEVQPCPLCGEFNSSDKEKCRICALGIINDKL